MHRLRAARHRGSKAASARRRRRARHPRPPAAPVRPPPHTTSRLAAQVARAARAPRDAARGRPPAPCARSPARGSPTTTRRAPPAAPRARRATRAAGTSALRMAVHFCPALTVISRTTSRTNSSNSGVPAAASGARIEELSESVSAVKRTELAMHDRVLAQLERGGGRAGEGHDVLAGEVIEQIAHAAADQLHRPLRQDPRLDDAAEHALGEVAGLRRRLHDRRHAGEQRRRQLLQHAPHREIEGVDVHRGAFERHAEVLADESCRPSTAPRRPPSR